MNGKRMIDFLAKTLLTACIFLSMTAISHAIDPVTPFKDPLKTLPDVINSGVTLPGDATVMTCQGDMDFSAPLTLSKAVDMALCNNPQIKAAWASIKVQAGALGVAKAAYLPTASATLGRSNSSTTELSSTSTTTGDTVYGSVSWRLFDFGGRSANQQAASDLLLAALDNHNATLQKTLAAVIQAYFDAQTAKAALEAKKQDEAVAANTLDATKRRETKGAGSVGDTLQATTAYSRAVLGRNRAQGDYDKALSVLAYAMGIPAQTPITLADDLYDKTSPDSRDLDQWLDYAQTKHPAILAARAQFDAAKEQITVSRSAALPTVDFSANYDMNGYPGQSLAPYQSNSYAVGISITIPLFDGFSSTYKIRSAEAQSEQREAEMQDTEHNILMEVVKAYADASSSFHNLQSSETLIDAAQAALASSQRKFDKGAADILEILNAQTAMADANQERIRCLAEWRGARLRLMANAGLLGRTLIGCTDSKSDKNPLLQELKP